MTRLLLLTMALLLATAGNAEPCQVMYPPSAVGAIHGADLIVRAVNRGYLTTPPTPPDRGGWTLSPPLSPLQFDVVEVLKGAQTNTQVILDGYEAQTDDFNDRSVPYDFVRPGGRSGRCFANTYKVGAEYLLMLRYARSSGDFTVDWYMLGAVNEQLRSEEDPWLLWVRDELETRAGLLRELADAESRWQANRPSAYEFVVDAQCSCPVAFRVTGEWSEEIGDLVSDRYRRYETVERLFAEVRRLIDERPERLLVKYNNEFSFPAIVDMMKGFYAETLTLSVWGFKSVSDARVVR